jgi:hypothetical protein
LQVSPPEAAVYPNGIIRKPGIPQSRSQDRCYTKSLSSMPEF